MNRFADVWLPRACFVFTLGAAVCLTGAVLLTPWIADSEQPLLTLFAHDLTVRRTSLFSALGLVVTAFVFFRPRRTPEGE